jgi:hypothetical protein
VVDLGEEVDNAVVFQAQGGLTYVEPLQEGPDLTLGDPVRPPRAHDKKGPILYTFAHKYYYFGLIFFRENIYMGLSGRELEVGKYTH